MDKKDINYNALFIGDKAENGANYINELTHLLHSHMGWRKNYIPGDMPAISEEEKRTPEYEATLQRQHDVLTEVDRRLREGTIPWMSAGRYWGQMNSDTLSSSMLAYSEAMLWNSNNVALESSMATSKMEAEVGDQIAGFLGYKKGWGHITHDGSIANLEALWYMRQFKSIPLALKEVVPDTVKGLSEWELLNMSVEKVLDILKKLTPEQIDAVKAHSSRSGKNIQKLGKLIVPYTKHYSWLKALDITGVGIDQMVQIPVKNDFRQNVDILKEKVKELASKHIPILGVVAVVGTTEEGQVDEVDKIVKFREEMEKQGVYFYIHVDAAYGGYGRALFIDENNNFVEYDQLQDMFKKHHVFNRDVHVDKHVYEAFKAIKDTESTTIDPHKMGYVQYAAGSIAIKYESMRNVISYFAPYVFEKKTAEAPDMLGSYILAGSKAGATAAGVWAANKTVPLNITGYGRLVGASIETAQQFREFLKKLQFNINGKTVKAYPLDNPDFNMVDWVLKIEGETDLQKTNELNEKMFDFSSFYGSRVYSNLFLTSHTIFRKDTYGDSPVPFIERMGFTKNDWEKIGAVTLLRAAIMTPYLHDPKTFEFYTKSIANAMEKKLKEIL
ncbi:pyridoxal phosphate-dependent decarboxylase family protein [Limosilactobacillus reuteri]|uniref:pyridoxal phosphate-dependent decarboxylase family protein n=1 Tax=Limosilactobacillus reuteri TaxID=1598 RepID=UPI001C5B5C15|nr:pyridoxal-dependent decarboxylase [Limosilactobacillus reuteri]MBW3350928.1 tyrosine decarboxylase [Limosilactobacillus reuteri]MCC4380718.1 tyrosine decarboxylase [Limosilactobacillus reuteri]UUW69036.1 pyridoxal-dependent decarboxylase [Limosilactobacillus reuteri]